MNNRIIYLDNAATTQPSQNAAEAFLKTVSSYGNPSSLHALGLEAEKLINGAKKTIADKMGVDSRRILFTSGGTEANNTAIFGAANSRRKIGNRIITTKIEHPSVLEACKKLEKDGFDVIFADAGRDGRVDLDMIENALTEDTILVSVMHTNNETGVMQPVGEIKKMMAAASPKAVLHSDCVQSFGKVDIKSCGADLITVSAHKIHGFKGTGALYVKDFRMIRPLLYGGEQQSEMRPGTENIGGILAFARAASDTDTDNTRLVHLRSVMKDALSALPYVQFNGSDEFNSGSILNVSFLGIKAEILLHAFESRGVFVSTGSACSSHKPQPSHVLGAMGLSKKEIEGAVRISFDYLTSEADVLDAAKIILEEAENIKKYM